MLALKEEVYKANLELVQRHLALCSWGNVSAIDRDKGVVIIKPHNLSFEALRPGDMVVLDLDGNIIDGKREPSYDAAMHLVLYKKFPQIGGVVHSHSTWATCWAQAGRAIPALGTTHSDCFLGDIPCTRPVMEADVHDKYEEETGKLIVETFKDIDPMKVPAVLIHRHGPVTWGETLHGALTNATILEEVARLALHTLQINPTGLPMPQYLTNKHFRRSSNR